MDWMNRSVHQNESINQPVNHPTGQHSAGSGKSKNFTPKGWLRFAFVTLLFSGTALIVSLLIYTAMGSRTTNEGRYVDTTKTQAVFLNGGQVYFGKIKALNSKYLRLDDVFYLRVNQPAQTNSNSLQNSTPELVSLGCELHRPQKEMIINRDQVTFWENLKDESDQSTVPGAVKKYLADNPNGQKCVTTPTPSDTTTKKP